MKYIILTAYEFMDNYFTNREAAENNSLPWTHKDEIKRCYIVMTEEEEERLIDSLPFYSNPNRVFRSMKLAIEMSAELNENEKLLEWIR